jgi:hypothetical protein
MFNNKNNNFSSVKIFIIKFKIISIIPKIIHNPNSTIITSIYLLGYEFVDSLMFFTKKSMILIAS